MIAAINNNAIGKPIPKPRRTALLSVVVVGETTFISDCDDDNVDDNVDVSVVRDEVDVEREDVVVVWGRVDDAGFVDDDVVVVCFNVDDDDVVDSTLVSVVLSIVVSTLDSIVVVVVESRVGWTVED